MFPTACPWPKTAGDFFVTRRVLVAEGCCGFGFFSGFRPPHIPIHSRLNVIQAGMGAGVMNVGGGIVAFGATETISLI